MSYQGIAEYRTFGGKKYEYHSKYRTKTDAQKQARFLKGRGFKGVRVVPTPKSPLISYPEAKWLVYTRWTMPSRGK